MKALMLVLGMFLVSANAMANVSLNPLHSTQYYECTFTIYNSNDQKTVRSDWESYIEELKNKAVYQFVRVAKKYVTQDKLDRVVEGSVCRKSGFTTGVCELAVDHAGYEVECAEENLGSLIKG